MNVRAALPFVDTNGNGIDDNGEMAYFGNLLRTGTGDSDGDGMSAFAEYKAGTNPKDAQSHFAFLNAGPDLLGGVALRWSSVTSPTTPSSGPPICSPDSPTCRSI